MYSKANSTRDTSRRCLARSNGDSHAGTNAFALLLEITDATQSREIDLDFRGRVMAEALSNKSVPKPVRDVANSVLSSFVVCRQCLEPQVSYAAAIAWQVVEPIKPIEMVDRQVRNGFRRCEPKIYSHAPASIFLKAQSSPAKHATTRWAEVYF